MFNEETMVLLAYQVELTREGIPHIQGYVEFVGDVRLADVLELPGFKGYSPWVRPAWASRESNLAYVSKRDRLDGPFVYRSDQ